MQFDELDFWRTSLMGAVDRRRKNSSGRVNSTHQTALYTAKRAAVSTSFPGEFPNGSKHRAESPEPQYRPKMTDDRDSPQTLIESHIRIRYIEQTIQYVCLLLIVTEKSVSLHPI